MSYRHSGHMLALRAVERRKFVRDAKKLLRESKIEFDSIAFSGMSGAVVAPMLATVLKKEVVMVRKEQDRAPYTHSEYRVEGYSAVKRYIIVDDFVSTGDSARYIVKQIHDHFTEDAVCVGVFSYFSDRYNDPKFYAQDDYRIAKIFQPTKSSVPKIDAADDPTVARDTTLCGCGVAQACPDCLDSKRSSSSFSLQANTALSLGAVASALSDIPDGVDMEDVPVEAEAGDIAF